MSERSSVSKHVNTDDDDVTDDANGTSAQEQAAAANSSLNTDAIDEDELLYGDTSSSALPDVTSAPEAESTSAHAETSKQGSDDAAPSYWGVLATESGELEVYSLPDFNLVYYVKNFCIAPQLLLNALCNEVEHVQKTT